MIWQGVPTAPIVPFDVPQRDRWYPNIRASDTATVS